MKKTITFILFAIAFASAMTLSESKNESKHCRTYFKNLILDLGKCKLGIKETKLSSFKCTHGMFSVSPDLSYISLISGDNVLTVTKYQNSSTPCEYRKIDKYGIIEETKYLYAFPEDYELIYAYFKNVTMN